jgi:acetyl-CoA acetyltransferase
VALVVGADTTPKGFFAPQAGERGTDPDWLRFRLLGATNPVYFALYARRRMALYGATDRDFARVKVKNARHWPRNPNARYRKGGHRGGGPRLADGVRSAAAPRDLRHQRRRRRARPVEHGVRAAADDEAGDHDRRVDGDPPLPEQHHRDAELRHRLRGGRGAADLSFRDSIAAAAYAEAGVGAGDVDVAEVYDLSSALELDWYENIGLCRPGEAERLLNDGVTTLGGRVPVNPSGGLACFGEAIPAQAIAQVCELTWQLRGQATGRQVEGAKLGVSVNQGLFGHGSSVVVQR